MKINLSPWSLHGGPTLKTWNTIGSLTTIVRIEPRLTPGTNHLTWRNDHACRACRPWHPYCGWNFLPSGTHARRNEESYPSNRRSRETAKTDIQPMALSLHKGIFYWFGRTQSIWFRYLQRHCSLTITMATWQEEQTLESMRWRRKTPTLPLCHLRTPTLFVLLFRVDV
jgi:hypothetical protein